jgi:hypothetical protein
MMTKIPARAAHAQLAPKMCVPLLAARVLLVRAMRGIMTGQTLQ